MKSSPKGKLLWLALAALIPVPVVAQDAVPTGVEMPLWEGTPPGNPADASEEITNGDRVSKVSIPTLTAYLPPKEKANGTAIILCSGGGYGALNLPKYAKLGCEAFLPQGIAVFNLKYRLSPIPRTRSLEDAKRAVRMVRAHAKEWNINPDRVGLVGASAGANLLANLAGSADDGNPEDQDPIGRQSSRPNFVCLLAFWTGGQKISSFQFTDKTAIYMLHAEDDTTAKVALAREAEAAAKAAGAPVQAKYFPTGGHDAFGSIHGKNGDWTVGFLQWLKILGLYEPNGR